MSLTKARELRQERAKLWDQNKADIAANPEGFTPELQEKFDKRNADIDAMKGQIDTIEANHRTMAEQAEQMAMDQSDADFRKEFGAKRESVESNVEEYREGFLNYIRGDMDIKELRALAVQTKGTAGLGGNTVPIDMEANITAAMKEFGGVRSVARIIRTDNGRNLDFPTSDDTGNVAQIVGEATAITATTAVPFAKVTSDVVKYHTGPIKVSRELEQDSVIDMLQFVQDSMVTRIGRITNTHYTTRSSTESAGPHGFTGESTGAVAVVNGALTPENLLSLIHSIDPAYRRGNQVGWQMADASLNTVRALRWGSSRAFVWEPSLKAGTPDRLLGYDVTVNQDTPLEGTSANKWIWFGNWFHYLVRDVRGLDLIRLDERYAEEDVIAYIGYMRTDGRKLTGSTVASLQPFRSIIQSTG